MHKSRRAEGGTLCYAVDVSSLPKGWTQHVDPETSKPFFYNAESGVSAWEIPIDAYPGIEDLDAHIQLNKPPPVDVLKRKICTYSKTKAGLKVYKYNINQLVIRGGASSSLVLGTVFTMDSTVVSMLCGQCLLALLAGSIAFADKDMTATSLDGFANLSNTLQAVVPFVLGLYISMTIERWWDLRTKALAPIYNSTANLCMIIGIIIPDVPRYDALREKVLKYATNSVELMIRAARAKDQVDDLVEKGVLTAEELGKIEGLGQYQRSMVMWPWIERLLFHACEESKVPENVFVVVVQQCFAAREGIQTIHTYLSTQIPFAYVHLINLIVNCNNIVASARCGMFIAIALKNMIEGEVKSEDIWGLVSYTIILFVVPVVYHGLLAISYVVQDPFGEEVLDFPINAFSEYVFESCVAVYAARKCPKDELFPQSSKLRDAEGERRCGSLEKWLEEKAKLEAEDAASGVVRKMSQVLDAEHGKLARNKELSVEELLDTERVKEGLARLNEKILSFKQSLIMEKTSKKRRSNRYFTVK
jgi:predicted membrane chloride channel (bestrophin family)